MLKLTGKKIFTNLCWQFLFILIYAYINSPEVLHLPLVFGGKIGLIVILGIIWFFRLFNLCACLTLLRGSVLENFGRAFTKLFLTLSAAEAGISRPLCDAQSLGGIVLIWSGSFTYITARNKYFQGFPSFWYFKFNLQSTLTMGESSKFPKYWTFETPFLKFAACPLNIHNFKFKWSNVHGVGQTENKSEKLLWYP